jgi:hypothetical protein
MLFAYLPEGLIVTAIAGIIAALATPVFSRLGFGTAASVGLGFVSGVAVVAGLVVRAWFADVLEARARNRHPPQPPSDRTSP